ncbi:hypothetical protein [Pseudomonas sp. NA-150]|uniref:hypothetical protein n=1 Tax=Pseudomonas sp. NA-150 TaxID=3367525 RepID=UPI0037C6F26B
MNVPEIKGGNRGLRSPLTCPNHPEYLSSHEPDPALRPPDYYYRHSYPGGLADVRTQPALEAGFFFFLQGKTY